MRPAAQARHSHGADAAASVARAIVHALFADQPSLSYRYQTIYCSQCGEAFGEGEEGYSDCEQHAHLIGRD